MSYLFVAYAIFWALSFAFIYSISSRQAKLEREIAAVREALGKGRS